MPTVLLTTLPSSPSQSELPQSLTIPAPHSAPARKRRDSNLDTLLKLPPRPRVAPELDQAPEDSLGIFLGLRVALLFNLGLSLAGVLGYEAWTLLAR